MTEASRHSGRDSGNPGPRFHMPAPRGGSDRWQVHSIGDHNSVYRYLCRVLVLVYSSSNQYGGYKSLDHKSDDHNDEVSFLK